MIQFLQPPEYLWTDELQEVVDELERRPSKELWSIRPEHGRQDGDVRDVAPYCPRYRHVVTVLMERGSSLRSALPERRIINKIIIIGNEAPFLRGGSSAK